MKLLVTAQALGTHADPADPDSFRSSPSCTASLSPLGGDSDSPLVSLELSQLPPRERKCQRHVTHLLTPVDHQQF